MEEWENACNEKIKKINRIYDNNVEKGKFFLKIHNSLLKKIDSRCIHENEIREFCYLIITTINTFDALFTKKLCNTGSWKKKLKTIKKVDEYYKLNEKSSSSKFNNFINNSWECYKKLKSKVGDSIVDLKEIASENGNTPRELDGSLADLKKQYALCLDKIKEKLRKSAKKLKKIGEDCGVVRVAKLQRWFLSSNSKFGILHFLDISIDLIDQITKEYDKGKSAAENFDIIYKNVIEEKTLESIQKINNFYREYSLSKFDKLLSRFESSMQHEPESLSLLFEFTRYIEAQNLDEQIRDLVNDAIEFYKKEISDQKANQKKINSEMKYVFRYIMKKINRICSDLKKEFKKKHSIFKYEMECILDFVKTKIISEFLDESKVDNSERVKSITDTISILVGVVVFCGTLVGSAAIASCVCVTLESIFTLSCCAAISVTLLPPAACMLAAPVGCFFYKSFKNFQHRKIRNKFKKFMKTKKQKNNSNDQPAAPPMNLDLAETPTPS